MDIFEPDFDHVYLIDGYGVITDTAPDTLYAPDVSHDEVQDVLIDGGPTLSRSNGSMVVNSGWDVLTGHTGQYSYAGAVMHPSEQWGQWAIDDLSAHALAGEGYIAFCIVEVRDENGEYPEGDAIGWAVAWRAVK